jgi:hypothetical protein
MPVFDHLSGNDFVTVYIIPGVVGEFSSIDSIDSLQFTRFRGPEMTAAPSKLILSELERHIDSLIQQKQVEAVLRLTEDVEQIAKEGKEKLWRKVFDKRGGG